MKKMIIAAVIAASSASPTVASDWKEMSELCAEKAGAAYVTMFARQLGMSKSDLMEQAKENEVIVGDLQEMVFAAFAQKIETAGEVRQRVMENFETDTFVQCIRRERANAR